MHDLCLQPVFNGPPGDEHSIGIVKLKRPKAQLLQHKAYPSRCE